MSEEEFTGPAIDAMLLFLNDKKAKKTPNKAECAEFSSLWSKVAHEEGLSKAVPFLCQGFTFAAAEPLYSYIKEKGNTANDYALINTYPSVRDSKNEIGLRIYLSLLACELVDPTSSDAIGVVVNAIASTAYNKEGKLSGNLASYIKKLLVSPLAGKSISPNVAVSLKPQELKLFFETVKPYLQDFANGNTASIKEACAAADILSWAHTLIGVAPEQEKRSGSETPALTEGNAMSNEQVALSQKSETNAEDVVVFIRAQQKKIESMKSQLATVESETSRLRSEKEKLSCRIAELEESLEKTKQRNQALNVQLEFEKKHTADLETDLAASKEYAEVVGKSVAKESDEKITRTARKLKVEYQDFQDALDLEMDADLGENMRLQLASVFKILKESGFDL